VDRIKLLRAVYQAIQWDRLYRLAPEATREQVDRLFGELRGLLDAAGAPAHQAATKAAGGTVHLHCDGASSGNPGPAGIGVVLSTPDGQELLARGEGIGRATNNVAEYHALIEGLKAALAMGARQVLVHSDSELLIRQLQGAYRVKSPNLQPLHRQAIALLGRFERWEARHVGREQNRRADALARQHAKPRSRP